MKNPSKEIKLDLEFDEVKVQSCNFNLRGELILFGTVKVKIKREYEKINIVCVYSIQHTKTKCQKIYEMPKEAEVISISEYDKIWFHFNNEIYEWNLSTGHSTILFKNVYEVINIIKIIIVNLLELQN